MSYADSHTYNVFQLGILQLSWRKLRRIGML